DWRPTSFSSTLPGFRARRFTETFLAAPLVDPSKKINSSFSVPIRASGSPTQRMDRFSLSTFLALIPTILPRPPAFPMIAAPGRLLQWPALLCVILQATHLALRRRRSIQPHLDFCN